MNWLNNQHSGLTLWRRLTLWQHQPKRGDNDPLWQMYAAD